MANFRRYFLCLFLFFQAKGLASQRVEFVLISPTTSTINIEWDGKNATLEENETKLKMAGHLKEKGTALTVNDIKVPVKKNGKFHLLLPYQRSFEMVLHFKSAEGKEKTDIVNVAVMRKKDDVVVEESKVTDFQTVAEAPKEESSGKGTWIARLGLTLSSPYYRAFDYLNYSNGYLNSLLAIGLGLEVEHWRNDKYFFFARVGEQRSMIRDVDGKSNDNQSAFLFQFKGGAGMKIPTATTFKGRLELGVEDTLLPVGVSASAISMHKLSVFVMGLGVQHESELSKAYTLNTDVAFGFIFSRTSSPFVVRGGNILSLGAKVSKEVSGYQMGLGPYYKRRSLSTDIVSGVIDELGLHFVIS